MESWLGAAPPEDVDAGAVRLRHWQPDDAQALVTLVTDNVEHLRPWMPWAQEAPRLEEERWFLLRMQDLWAARTDFAYAVVLDGAGPIGGMGLHTRQGPGILEIGYWIAAAHNGRGYCTAAARALTTTAFGLPGVDRVEIRCDRSNLASAAVPRKLGYELVDIIQRAPVAPAETGWGMIWSIDRERWEQAPL